MPGCVNGSELAIWRSVSGQVHAWGDRCPHRGMRLSHGFVRGEALSCIYHGWQYDADGACAYIPAHPNLDPPKSICAKTYRCKEADGVIWVSMTDTDDEPVTVPASAPVRSLQIEASMARVAAHFGDPGATLVQVGDTPSIVLLLQNTRENVCTVHALTHSQEDRLDVSRWLEAQRIQIEEVEA